MLKHVTEIINCRNRCFAQKRNSRVINEASKFENSEHLICIPGFPTQIPGYYCNVLKTTVIPKTYDYCNWHKFCEDNDRTSKKSFAFLFNELIRKLVKASSNTKYFYALYIFISYHATKIFLLCRFLILNKIVLWINWWCFPFSTKSTTPSTILLEKRLIHRISTILKPNSLITGTWFISARLNDGRS